MFAFDDEEVGPDPEEVYRLVEAMGTALNDTIIPGETTQADVLSALFTMLHRALSSAKDSEEPHEHERNAHAVGKVLTDFLTEFGMETLH